MPTPTEPDPARLEEIRRLLAAHQPAYELIGVESETRPALPRPSEAELSDQPPVSVSSPSLKTLQDHYRKLGFSASSPHLPDPPREQPDEETRRLNPDAIRCRVRRLGTGSDAPELTVMVSIGNGTVTVAPTG